jgi:soluble lytic murein transglycosylase-like protein
MTERTKIVALALLATVSTASADANRASPIQASVDASGHVTLGAPSGGAPERIDPANASTPCATAPALPPDEARALVQKIATQEKFYPDFVLSVVRQESGFNSMARSPKGAFGLMQLTPETAARFHVDLCDPYGNVLGGVRFLRALHEKYHNPFFILAAYNAGEAVVDRTHGVPPYPETVRFVAEVINDFYDWPTPGRTGPDNSRGVASRSPSASGLVEAPVAAPSTPPSAPAPSPAQKGGWDSGFVMNVD